MKNYSNYETRKVVITVDKNVTLARVFNNNNEVVSNGVAKCSPEDIFDFQTGAELAMKRAFESIPKKVEQKWKVVKRPAKVGDYIRLKDTGYRYDKVGDIHRIDIVEAYNTYGVLIEKHSGAKKWIEEEFNGNWFNDYWYYDDLDCEVVEPVEEGIEIINGERFRKVDRIAKPGDYMRVIKSSYPCEKRGEIYKISIVSPGGDNVGVKHTDHPAHYELYKDNPIIPNSFVWWHYNAINQYEILEKL